MVQNDQLFFKILRTWGTPAGVRFTLAGAVFGFCHRFVALYLTHYCMAGFRYRVEYAGPHAATKYQGNSFAEFRTRLPLLRKGRTFNINS